MTTLLAVYSSSGLVGRCDATCYDARLPFCECICGGRNHRAGRARAEANSRALAEAWRARAAEPGALPSGRLELFPADTLF